MNLLKKLISYLYPINIKTIPSKRSGSLEVTLTNGKLLIDSENANYSYGSLQKVLKKGLLQIDESKLNNVKSILVLGVAGGSVIQTLREDFKLTAKITGVEIDSDILSLANNYFHLDKTTNLELIIADAFAYINTTNEKHDLIIIDIFNDANMPKELFGLQFWDNIYNALNKNGLCLFNTIYTSKKDIDRNTQLAISLKNTFSTINTFKTERINELFLFIK